MERFKKGQIICLSTNNLSFENFLDLLKTKSRSPCFVDLDIERFIYFLLIWPKIDKSHQTFYEDQNNYLPYNVQKSLPINKVASLEIVPKLLIFSSVLPCFCSLSLSIICSIHFNNKNNCMFLCFYV